MPFQTETAPLDRRCRAPSIVRRMGLSWPLQVGSHAVIPVEVDAGTDRFHLVQTIPGDDAASAVLVDPDDDPAAARPDRSGGDPDRSVWQTRTLCGRPRGHLALDADGLDLVGKDRGRLCQACWRTVEGWLSAPPPSTGEGEVIRWVVATVLETGEAMVEGVPVPRLESIRRQIRSELKAAIGGTVRTAKMGQSALWVWSGIVNDAKTPERLQEEMRAAAERMWAPDDAPPVEPARWRRTWSEIVDAE
jgi:hypothetical protein